MSTQFYMGFWNYVNTGDIDNVLAISDWKKMGMNLPMSWEYIEGESDKQKFIEMLNLCDLNGMKVIVCDSRTRWHNLTQKGEKLFNEDIKAAVADFGSHKAVFGFHIGDEPTNEQMPDMIKAYKTVKQYATHLTPFVNLLPYWEDYADENSYNKHLDFLNEVVEKSKMEIICYDYYGQMATNEQDRLVDLYFKNLNLFGTVAKRNNIPLWTTLLSTAHYNSKTLTEDDIMWQISTAVAHGCSGILWFYIYFHDLVNASYRNYPISNYSSEIEYGDVYFYLSRQNRIFLKHYATKLHGYDFDQVRHFNISYGFTKMFIPNEFEISGIELLVNKEAPLIISRYFNQETKKCKYLIVNNDREKSVKLKLSYKGNYTQEQISKMQAPDLWIAAGQMTMIDII